MLGKLLLPVLAAVTLAAGPAAAAQSASELLEKGIYTEETVGDLDAAMKIYRQIVSDARANRPHVAQAQYRLGMCYLKKGQKQQAAGAFQKLIDRFPRQTKLVLQAQARLAELGKPTSAVVVRQVWAPAADAAGSVSADRRYLSYVDWETGDLALRELATGKTRRLTNKGPWSESPEFALESAFSPDGKQIAYTWINKDNQDLRIVGTDGGESRVVPFDKRELVWFELVEWSPGGKHVLVTLERRNGTSQIALISAAEGSARIVKSFDGRYPTNPRMSPDGQYVAYSMPSVDSDSADVFLLAVDSDQESVLVSHAASDIVLGWTPRGDRLLFASDRSGSVDAWTIPLSEGKANGSAQLVKAELGQIDPITITADGSLFYSVSIGGFEVYVASIDRKTGKLLKSPKPASSRFAGSNVMPFWSRDGRTLAFSSVHRRTGGGRVLCFLTPETGQQREFPMRSKLLANFHGLSWSPDNRFLVARNMDATNYRRGLFQIDTQTGDVTVLAYSDPKTRYTQPQWCPDGKAILYLRVEFEDTMKRRIVRYDLRAGQHEELFRDERPFEFALSPDGRQVAVVTEHKDSKSLLIKRMPVAGGDAQEVLRLPNTVRVGSLRWSPDGRDVLYLKSPDRRGLKTELWQISAQGREPKKFDVDMPRMRGVTIHPDGRQIAFQAGEEETHEIWVMENFLPEPEPEKPSGVVVRQLWADAQVASFFLGAPSPEGKYLSYVDWNSGGNLAIRELATGKNRQLTSTGSVGTSPGEEFAQGSVFSPDGKQVAYYWYNDGSNELCIVDLEGSEPRVLRRSEGRESVEPRDWSPDGKHILAVARKKDRTLQIVLVSVADGSVQVLKKLELERRRQKISFSPDGRYVVYDVPSKKGSLSRDIFLLATDGSHEAPLVEHPADDFVLGWAPDGKRILFASDRAGSMGAWIVEVADGRAHREPVPVKLDMGPFHPLGLTRAGGFYYGVDFPGTNVDIATLDPDTGRPLTAPVRGIRRFEGYNSAPDWSPDGRYLVCQSNRPGEASVLCIRDLVRDEVRVLTPKPELRRLDPYLRWSPDGRSILATGHTFAGGGQRQGLFQIDVQTAAVSTLTDAGSDLGGLIFQPVWSPDGKAIFYTRSLSEACPIVRRDLKTGTEKELYRDESPLVRGLTLSPDGRQFAFSAGGALKLLPVTGGEPRELAKMLPRRGTIAWTHDGRYLLFSRKGDPNNGCELWRIAAEGGAPEKLDLATWNFRSLRVHPDGKRAAFTTSLKSKTEVWVMEDFLPEVETDK